MKIWLISDTHFGKYAIDSDKWLNIMTTYFYDFFIPTLKKHKKDGDILFFLGDLYDNRTSINIKVINTVVKLFEDLSQIIDIHIILGNHDNFNMLDTDINSICTIRNIKNITIYDKPQQININNTSVAIMPWIYGKNNEIEILKKYKGSDLLLCHSDLNGCRTQLYPTRPTNKNILDINDFSGYNKVYSGHIHIVQEINNFTFVGCPYHLDRNDYGNKKGIFVYDTKTKNDIFIENNYSPEFKKIKILKETDFDILKNELQTNNFIDLEISNNLLLNSPHLRLELDKLTNKYKIENLEFINDIVKDIKPRLSNITLKNKSIKDISHEWIDSITINDDTDLFTEIELKNKMKLTIENCFNLIENK